MISRALPPKAIRLKRQKRLKLLIHNAKRLERPTKTKIRNDKMRLKGYQRLKRLQRSRLNISNTKYIKDREL